MNKRTAVLGILDEADPQAYIPAAFFIHFDPMYHKGQAAVDKHLAFFNYTGMDFVKIQYETEFPRIPEIKRPEDWSNMPFYKRGFYQDQLDVVAGLVNAAKKDALVLMTLYSPFMCARATAGEETVNEHIRVAPEKVKKGMEIITESLMIFVKGCIALGVDGFYTSTQGGEVHRFTDSACFRTCIKPYDLALMDEIDAACNFNIFHICDFRGEYKDLSPFFDYPGHVVNFGNTLDAKEISGQEISRMFQRPFMGGMDRMGVIARGDETQIRAHVQEVLNAAPDRFILAADCTLPDNVNWDNIKTAISAAHAYAR